MMLTGKNLLLSILTGLLFVSAVLSAISAVLYVRGSGELRGLQGQAASIENNRAVARALAAESLEYSKRNPSIDPLLQTFGLKAPLSSPRATK